MGGPISKKPGSGYHQAAAELRRFLSSRAEIDDEIVKTAEMLAETPEGKKELLRIHYDLIAHKWDMDMAVHYESLYRVLKGLKDILSTKEGQKIADFTCGTGELMAMLFGKRSDPFVNSHKATVHMSDLAEQMMEIAKAKMLKVPNSHLIESLTAEVQDVDTYAFDSVFDLIVMSQSFPFLVDQEQTLKVISNALKPGGMFLLIEENPFLVSVSGLIGYRRIYDIISPAANIRTPEVIDFMAEEVGLKITNPQTRVFVPVDNLHGFVAHPFSKI